MSRCLISLVLTVLAALALAACAPAPGKGLFKRQPDPTAGIPEPTSGRYLALQQVQAPALQVVVEDRSQRDLMLFSHRLDGVELWYGRDGVQLGLRDGMLAYTRGIGGDLMAADTRQSHTLLASGQSGTAKRFHSYLNGNDQIETDSYICDIRRVQDFTLAIGEARVPTWYMVETCHGPDLIFENYYWVDRRSGLIQQSRQLANPFSGRVAFQRVLS